MKNTNNETTPRGVIDLEGSRSQRSHFFGSTATLNQQILLKQQQQNQNLLQAMQGQGSVASRCHRLIAFWRRDVKERRLRLQYRWGTWLSRPFSQVLQSELRRKLGDSVGDKTVEEVVHALAHQEPRQWNTADANRVTKRLQGASYAQTRGVTRPKIGEFNWLLSRCQIQDCKVRRGDRAWKVLDILGTGPPPRFASATLRAWRNSCTTSQRMHSEGGTCRCYWRNVE